MLQEHSKSVFENRKNVYLLISTYTTSKNFSSDAICSPQKILFK